MEQGSRSSDFTDKDVEEYATLCGISKQSEEQLYQYIKRLVMQPLPTNWDTIRNAGGKLEYVNKLTVKRLRQHPCNEHHMEQIKAYQEQLSTEAKVRAAVDVVNETSSALDTRTGISAKSQDQNALDSTQDEHLAQHESAAFLIKKHNNATNSFTEAREGDEMNCQPPGDDKSVQDGDMACKEVEHSYTSYCSTSSEQQQAADRSEPIGAHSSANELLPDDRSKQTADRVEESKRKRTVSTILCSSRRHDGVAENADKYGKVEEKMPNEPANLEGIHGFAAQIGIKIPQESDLLAIAKVGYAKLTELRKRRDEGCDMCRRFVRKEEQELTSKYTAIVEATKDGHYRDAQLWESTVQHAYECDQIQKRIAAMLSFSP